MKYSKYNLVFKIDEYNKWILFNTLTGHTFFISSETAELVKSSNLDDLDQSTKDQFKLYNVIIPDNLDETRIFSYNYNKSKYSSSVISSTVLLTWACNLACIYCFEGGGKKTNRMTFETADSYIKFMISQVEAKHATTLSIHLFGGEPLVNIDVGFYILDNLKKYCDNNKITFVSTIITNGTLLTEEIIQKLEQYNCIQIQITLDGLAKTHDERRFYKNGNGSFKDIIHKLLILNNPKHRLRTIIRINIDKTNLQEAHDLLEYLGKDGLNLTNCFVDFGVVHGSTESCSAYSDKCIVSTELGEILTGFWDHAQRVGFLMNIKPIQRFMYCGLYGDNQFTITPEGDLYKCWELAGEKEHYMGHINQDGQLIDIQYTFFDWMSKMPLENPDCKTCVYLPACGGGCAAESYNSTKSYHAKGCFKTKGVLEQQIRRYINEII